MTTQGGESGVALCEDLLLILLCMQMNNFMVIRSCVLQSVWSYAIPLAQYVCTMWQRTLRNNKRKGIFCQPRGLAVVCAMATGNSSAGRFGAFPELVSYQEDVSGSLRTFLRTLCLLLSLGSQRQILSILLILALKLWLC